MESRAQCRKALIFLLVMLGLPPWSYGIAAEAYRLDGNELLQSCTGTLAALDTAQGSQNLSFSAGWCMGYVSGFSIGYDAASLGAFRICEPSSGIPNGQRVRVVVQWLRTHPALLHLDRDILVGMALPMPSPVHPRLPRVHQVDSRAVKPADACPR